LGIRLSFSDFYKSKKDQQTTQPTKVWLVHEYRNLADSVYLEGRWYKIWPLIKP
jgi:hypothetical protein